MIRIVIISILMGTGLLGCATHYQHIKDNTLYLYLKAPKAQRVEFASSMDGFKRHDAFKINPATWTVTLPSDKEFKYFYLVDGAVVVPFCHDKEKDDFGSENCIFMPDM